MIHIALCDDNAEHLNETQTVVARDAAIHGQLVSLHPFSSANALLLSIRNHELDAKIAILDIAMQEMDGIALARQINEASPDCQIIFLTGCIDYVMDVYETNHVYYVLKEKLRERIWPAIEKAYAHYLEVENDFVSIQTHGGASLCRCSEIFYAERIGRRTCIHTAHGELLTNEPLPALLDGRLPPCFIRCHQSFVVNLDQVSALEGSAFLLRDGTQIPISRACKKEAESEFWKHLHAWVLKR